MDYAIASLVFAIGLIGYVALLRLYTHTTRRLKSAEASLAANAAGVHELVAENLEMVQRLNQLQKTEIEYFDLRREYARATTTLQNLSRIEHGLRTEIARLQQRQTPFKASA